MSAKILVLCCPLCKGDMLLNEEAYYCVPCQRGYPIILGIPDFRIYPDPYIDYEDDHNKARYLVENSRELDFEGMLRLYWQITPHVSSDRAERFIRHALALVDKGVADLREIEQLSVGRGHIGSRSVLEIGCGTGGFLVAASQRFEQVIGYDIAFRWLVIAKKRLEEAGLDIPLICGCTEHMPFRDESFDLVVAEDVIEHVRQQDTTLDECYRVAVNGGAFFLSTPNRFSLTPEPHVRVWGVGFLPRRLMKPYVKLVKGIKYDFIRVLSLPELKRLLRNSHFEDARIVLPTIPPEEVKNFSAFEKLQVKGYDLIRKTPIARVFLFFFGPFFHALSFVRKTDSRKAPIMAKTAENHHIKTENQHANWR